MAQRRLGTTGDKSARKAHEVSAHVPATIPEPEHQNADRTTVPSHPHTELIANLHRSIQALQNPLNPRQELAAAELQNAARQLLPDARVPQSRVPLSTPYRLGQVRGLDALPLPAEPLELEALTAKNPVNFAPRPWRNERASGSSAEASAHVSGDRKENSREASSSSLSEHGGTHEPHPPSLAVLHQSISVLRTTLTTKQELAAAKMLGAARKLLFDGRSEQRPEEVKRSRAPFSKPYQKIPILGFEAPPLPQEPIELDASSEHQPKIIAPAKPIDSATGSEQKPSSKQTLSTRNFADRDDRNRNSAGL